MKTTATTHRRSITARGYGTRITRRRRRITISPSPLMRLRGARVVRFYVDDVRAVLWQPATWLHAGRITFDLGIGIDRDDGDDPLTVIYPYRRRGEFTALITACRWRTIRP